MARASSNYVCQQCGYETSGWYGKCPNCQTFGSLVETVITQERTKGKEYRRKDGILPVELSSVKQQSHQRISSGIEELDRVLGGGFVPGQVVLLAGEPGIGKSTILSQVAEKIYSKSAKKHILYIAGEESTRQIRLRTSRLGLKGEGVFIIEETDTDEVANLISNQLSVNSSQYSVASKVKTPNRVPPTEYRLPNPETLIIVDSIQTLSTDDLSGMAGSIGQVRESAARLASMAKKLHVPLVLVGHVTKEGVIAGPRVLEHMVDTVLWFEGDRSQPLRILRAIKNRFGPTDEIGIFTMEEQGLVPVSKPTLSFTSELKRVSGQITTVLLEGTRPLLVEIQALVVPTKLAMPRRVVQGIDVRRVDVILAVLTRRVGLPLYNFDVFINVAGGIQIREPAADLAVALAIASAWANKALPQGTVAMGEVGLLGDVRSVPQFARRAKEARRLGGKILVSHETVQELGKAVKELVKNS